MRSIFCALPLLLATLGGCVVTRPASRSNAVIVTDRRCPPAHHYEAGAGCVHNGKAKGHYK
jgi:hypothetical protein